jgi:hypothetical protein
MELDERAGERLPVAPPDDLHVPIGPVLLALDAVVAAGDEDHVAQRAATLVEQAAGRVVVDRRQHDVSLREQARDVVGCDVLRHGLERDHARKRRRELARQRHGLVVGRAEPHPIAILLLEGVSVDQPDVRRLAPGVQQVSHVAREMAADAAAADQDHSHPPSPPSRRSPFRPA